MHSTGWCTCSPAWWWFDLILRSADGGFRGLLLIMRLSFMSFGGIKVSSVHRFDVFSQRRGVCVAFGASWSFASIGFLQRIRMYKNNWPYTFFSVSYVTLPAFKVLKCGKTQYVARQFTGNSRFTLRKLFFQITLTTVCGVDWHHFLRQLDSSQGTGNVIF